jgi:hypothetical protein
VSWARRDEGERVAAGGQRVADGAEALGTLRVSGGTAVLPIPGVLDDRDAACGGHCCAWYLRGLAGSEARAPLCATEHRR